MSEEEVFEEKLEDLKDSLINLYEILPCLKQCSYLSNHLQEVFELREGLNQSGLEALILKTRHQAAVSFCQVSDGLVIVVSEEKGWISLALRDQLYPNIGTSALLQKFGNRKKAGNHHINEQSE